MFDRSTQGQTATRFERALIDKSDPRDFDASLGQWLDLAKRVGVDAILAVLDEFAGEKLRIVSRKWLFDRLERPMLDAMIASAYRLRPSVCEIAKEFSIGRRRVYRSLQRSGVVCDGKGSRRTPDFDKR